MNIHTHPIPELTGKYVKVYSEVQKIISAWVFTYVDSLGVNSETRCLLQKENGMIIDGYLNGLFLVDPPMTNAKPS